MNISTDGPFLLSGDWRFDQTKISASDLIKVAEQWSKDPNYTFLCVRGCSREQISIFYVYKLETTPGHVQEDSDAFFDKGQDLLYRQFGTGLVGWNMDAGSVVVKQ